MSVKLTDAAADRVRSHLEKRGGGEGMRFGIKKSGCSGFAYVVDFADAVENDDNVYESKGVNVIVDTASLPFVDGTLIDFRREGLNEVFVYENPNVKSECGCGESFGIS
jgi:iron-sulfur cluster assembly protein